MLIAIRSRSLFYPSYNKRKILFNENSIKSEMKDIKRGIITQKNSKYHKEDLLCYI